MKHTQLLEEMRILKSEELVYKKLYLKNPDLYTEPVKNWDEMKKRFERINETIPDSAPTAIKDTFSDDDFALKGALAVTAILHARYTPAFLHHHSFIKMVYVLRGNCIHMNEQHRIAMKEGDFCIVPPHMVNATFSCNDEDNIVNVLMSYDTFSTAFLSLLTEHDAIADFFWQMMYHKRSNQLLMFHDIHDPALDGIILDIINELVNEKPPINLILKSYVMLFFGNVLRKHISKARFFYDTSAQNKLIPDIIKYINKNVTYINLPSLAAKFHLSEGYLSRLIRQETGQTFSKLLKNTRLKIAAEMLINSSLSVQEIINAVGYMEPSRFFKNFRELYNMPPLAYRKSKTDLII